MSMENNVDDIIYHRRYHGLGAIISQERMSMNVHEPNKDGRMTNAIGKGIKGAGNRKDKLEHCENCKCNRYTKCGCTRKQPKAEAA